jgi:hypothetical protein
MPKTIIALLALFVVLAMAQPPPVKKPSPKQVRDATALCVPGAASVPTGIIGISDPNTVDPFVDALIAETGVNWVRAEFHWSLIDPDSDGVYDWADYDAMVARFNSANIKVLGILTYIPGSQPYDWGVVSDNFETFTAAAVQRYAPLGVHHWEVFNEPNLPGFGWLTKQDDPADYLGAYTLLLARANRAVRDNDPEGVVVIGGMASDQSRGISIENAMDTIYGYGAKDCFDVMAFHPYGYQNQFPAARARVDAVLADAGDSKPVWFNEYGWTDFESMDLAVNPDANSNPMIAAVYQAMVLQNADAFFWFSAKDYSAQPGTPTFGLATFDLEKRASFETFRLLVEYLEAN